MEANKILAAVLTAGIIAYLAGFISHKLTETEKLKENAYKIEVANAAAPGAAAAPAGPEPIKDLMAKADAAHGEQISKICGSCHSFHAADGNKIGPNLDHVAGRARGSVADFAYSDAMKAKGGSWDEASLNEFIYSPKDFVPGTKMTYGGLKNTKDRADLIKWIETHN